MRKKKLNIEHYKKQQKYIQHSKTNPNVTLLQITLSQNRKKDPRHY